jgi:hypothetical protein
MFFLNGTAVNMKHFICIFCCIFISIARPALGQSDSINNNYAIVDTLQEAIRLFDSNELIKISLRFDITQFKKKRSDEEYLDAILTYYPGEKDSINKLIKVRSRGEFRRTYCDFPPLMLNFKTEDSIKGEFSRINKLKMVTQCIAGNEESLLKEYLVYKLYNVLTENSFRVRLLRVNYINTSNYKKSTSEYAFVIEPVDFLASRLKAVEVKTTNLTQKKIRPEIMDRMAIFNYMIGNTDWSVPIQHNVVILSQGYSERPDLGLIVPYDFDFSGLVYTSYSSPFKDLKIKSVRERLYLGICRSEEVYINALREFSDLKEEFYRVINEFPYLKENSKKDMISYLNGFFNGIGKRNTVADRMLYDCITF